jgi:hypothetical protein
MHRCAEIDVETVLPFSFSSFDVLVAFSSRSMHREIETTVSVCDGQA